MFSPQVTFDYERNHRPAPFSTGNFPRTCRVCGAAFSGLGALCPTHLAAHARQRAQELQAQRSQSAQTITAREQAARTAQPKRPEWKDELDS